MPKKRTADEYAADGGFVVADDNGEEGGGQPAGNLPDASDDDDASDEDEGVRSKKPISTSKSKKQKTGTGVSGASETGVPGGGAVGKDGGEYWEISGKRRIALSEYAGKRMVNIREFYEDKNSGDMLPGKKGISLTTEQFDTLIRLLPAIESVLKGKGHTLPRPDYDGLGEESGGAVEPGKGEKSKKANFEETSEDE